MAYFSEDIKLASELFFYLLNNRILPLSNVLAAEYIENNQVREIINTMAGEAGLDIFNTTENLHLVTKKDGSIFATTYSQMKEKFSKLERKRYFHLANIIISIYLAEVDRDNNLDFRIEDSSISYYKLEEIITDTLENWKRRNEEEEFSKDFALAIEEIHKLWSVEMSHSRPKKDGLGFSLSQETRLGFINQALRPLEEENLIISLHDEFKIVARNELYERLHYLYHGGDRYQEIMELIKITRGESQDA